MHHSRMQRVAGHVDPSLRPGSGGGEEGDVEVLCVVHPSGCGELRLNRPRALNALTLGMVRTISRQLAAWRDDVRVRLVLMTGEGGRAFCAGGDIRSLVEPGRAEHAAAFFREEYLMDLAVSRYPKPVVALWDGIVMGGGVGLGGHAPVRLVTPATVFSMPETGIGLFPDVGGSLLLGRLGALGVHVGLTGARLGAADLLATGLATHFVPGDRVVPLLERLRGAAAPMPLPTDVGGVGRLLESEAFCPASPAAAGPSALMDGAAPRGAAACFGPGCPDMRAAWRNLEHLAAGGDASLAAWAAAELKVLAGKSPTSLSLTFRVLRESSQRQDLAAALRCEYRLAVRTARARRDFHEGVRALIVDKDNRPRWNPATLAGVGDALIESYFAPFSPEEGVSELLDA